MNIVLTLRSKPSHEAARLIGNASQYISDFNLINLLNMYDLNSKKNDAILMRQLVAFAGVPGLKEQISAWLSS